MIKVIKLAILLMTLVLCVADKALSDNDQARPCTTLLPEAATLALKQQFHGWRLLNTTDLMGEDRVDWQKTHPDTCPSVATGQYEEKNKVQYAALIIPEKKSANLKARLVMLRMTSAGVFKAEVLHEEKKLISYPVIYKASPGEYVDFYDPNNKVEVQNDTVIYDHIGSSALAFYFAGGKYKKVLISD